MVWRRATIGRLDPSYHVLIRNIKKSNYSLTLIGKSFIIKDGDHDKLPSEEITNHNEGYRYLRSQDLKDNKIIEERPVYVSERYFKKVKRCHIYPNDLLFSIMASVGATAIVPSDFPICTANRAIGILRQKKNTVLLPQYLQTVLNTNFGMELLEVEKRGGIQRRLNLSDIARILIPTPPFEVQQQIIKIYQNALQNKRQKEAEATALLESIDGYLLEQLGIELQAVEPQRSFFVKLSEVSDRLDPLYYSNFSRILSLIKYPTIKLKSVVKDMKSGFGAGKEEQSKRGILQIRPTNIGRYGGLKYNKNIFIATEKVTEPMYLEVGDILFNNTNSQAWVGKTSIVQDNEPYKLTFSNHITRIRIDENQIAPVFLTYILNLYQSQKIFYSLCTNWNNQSGVGLDRLKSLLIPLPPLAKQTEIAEHIDQIRQQAAQLKAEASAGITAAKAEVERMILGT